MCTQAESVEIRWMTKTNFWQNASIPQGRGFLSFICPTCSVQFKHSSWHTDHTRHITLCAQKHKTEHVKHCHAMTLTTNQRIDACNFSPRTLSLHVTELIDNSINSSTELESLRKDQNHVMFITSATPAPHHLHALSHGLFQRLPDRRDAAQKHMQLRPWRNM